MYKIIDSCVERPVGLSLVRFTKNTANRTTKTAKPEARKTKILVAATKASGRNFYIKQPISL